MAYGNETHLRYMKKGGSAMKKKIVIAFFTVLILATAVLSVVFAVDSYLYDMDPANGVDLLEGLGAIFALILGGVAVWYECDLFYTVYYFVSGPKKKAKTVLNIISHLSLFLVFFGDGIAKLVHVSEEIIVVGILFLIYVILRSVCLLIAVEEI